MQADEHFPDGPTAVLAAPDLFSIDMLADESSQSS